MAQVAWRPMSADEFVGAFDSYTGEILAAGATVRACPQCRRVVTESTWSQLGRAGCFSCNHTPLTTFRIPAGATVRPVPAWPVPATMPVPLVQAVGPRPVPIMYRQLEYLAVEDNLPAIVRDGLRAPGRATNIENADPRTTDAVPWVGSNRVDRVNGVRLVEYVPLFLNGRNAVMYTNLLNGRPLCVVRVRADAVNTPGTVLSDGPIARDATRFFDPFEAQSQIDLGAIKAPSWCIFGNPDSTTPTGRDERVKSAMQATLLVPDFVRAEMIEAIIAPSDASAARVRDLLRAQRITTQLPVSVNANRFFTMREVA